MNMLKRILIVLIMATLLWGCDGGFTFERYTNDDIDSSEYDYHEMYINGDTGDLTDKELEAFNEATRVYELYIKNCESDFDRVKAAHDYIVKNCTYNKAAIENDTLVDDDFTVYGTLVKGVSVCEGYARTFKMLMDIAGVDCIMVTGTVGEEAVSHAWNMVKLDNDWYHVDVTFDDPYPETSEIVYLYFNVTDEIMAKDHSWNKNVTPQADSEEYDYLGMVGVKLSNYTELKEYIAQCCIEEKMYISFVWSGEEVISDARWREVLSGTDITNISYSCLGIAGRRFYMINVAY